MNPQTKAILLLLCAVILLAIAIFPGAVFWETIRGFFYGVFGVGFILIPFLLGYLAIMTAKEKIIARPAAKVLLGTLIILLFSALFFIFKDGDHKTVGFFESMGVMYMDSFVTADGIGGGIISCLIGYPLVMLCGGTFLPAFLVIVFLVAALLLLTGISLVDIASVAKKRMASLRRKKEREPEVDPETGEVIKHCSRHPQARSRPR